MSENITCSICGEVIIDELHDVNGQTLCDSCFSEHTVRCDCCGEIIMRNDAEGDSFVLLCRHCYEYSYTHCEDCGALIHNDDAHYEDDSDYPYCDECFRRLNTRSIKNYSYKPEPVFYGSGNLFMGVELEIDHGGEYDENAEELEDIANVRQERIYCKHDGSIDDGFEIVSHPMSLDYHNNEMNWREVMDKAVRMGYLSHNTSTCGLHVHVNRTALGKDYDAQEVVIARIVHFFELHWNELVRFSRRNEVNLQRWASRYGISDSAKDTYKKAKDKHMGRYVAVNLENHSTVEFRMWRGTLRYETFIATLQLVHEICRFAVSLADKEIETMTWSEFVIRINSEHKELINYLKSKRLYVNELEEELKEV